MALQIARLLRASPTEAEKRLWAALRRRQLDGYRFRRQVPIGPYVVDFACLEQKLLIEVDGGQHALQADKDAQRSKWLEERDYRVLRFWNNDVLSNIEGVLAMIADALNEQ